MISTLKLPLEQKSREEAEEKRITFNSGAINFLLSRTQEKYRLKAVSTRRQNIELLLDCKFPEINDDILNELYQFACVRHMNRCRRDYGASSGFLKTSSETVFARTLSAIIQNNPKLKHLEIYPSLEYSKELPPGFKMVVGNYVPDFIVFGLKDKRTSGVAIEIDGDSHIDKAEKDQLRCTHFRQLKLFTWEIPNNQASDFKFISESMMSLYRLRNGSFNYQILRAKRGIWVKTISCQLTFSDIEEFVQQGFSIQLRLRDEAQAMLAAHDCPRKIRSELLNIDSNQKP